MGCVGIEEDQRVREGFVVRQQNHALILCHELLDSIDTRLLYEDTAAEATEETGGLPQDRDD